MSSSCMTSGLEYGFAAYRVSVSDRNITTQIRGFPEECRTTGETPNRTSMPFLLQIYDPRRDPNSHERKNAILPHTSLSWHFPFSSPIARC